MASRNAGFPNFELFSISVLIFYNFFLLDSMIPQIGSEFKFNFGAFFNIRSRQLTRNQLRTSSGELFLWLVYISTRKYPSLRALWENQSRSELFLPLLYC